MPVGIYCYFLAYDFVKGAIFVSNSANSAVSVISDNSNSVVTNVTVGTQPKGLVYDSDKGEIFVANYFSDTISIISDSDNKVVATVQMDANSADSGLETTNSVVTDVPLNTNSPNLASYCIDPMLANVTAPTRPTALAYIIRV